MRGKILQKILGTYLFENKLKKKIYCKRYLQGHFSELLKFLNFPSICTYVCVIIVCKYTYRYIKKEMMWKNSCAVFVKIDECNMLSCV